MHLRTGVDEERQRRLWRVSIEAGVMQHGAVVIEGNDVAVRQLGIGMADCVTVREMDLEF